MISFRYHIVSIIAVFLALALGIVIGTTALNGPITTDLRHQVDGLKGDRTSLAKQVKTLNNRVDDADQFASTYGQQLIKGKMQSTDTVLIIGMPNADSSVQDKLARDLGVAGATVTGRLELTNEYTDQRRGTDISSLATSDTRPAGLTLPTTSDPGQLGGALLAYVLLGQGESTDLTTVLAAFTQFHMITTSAKLTPAKTIVVVGNGALAANSYAASTELALVTNLQRAGGHVVVAGDSASATQAGLVASVRNNNAAKTTMSSVDDVDTAIGEITTVLTTADASRSTAQYGHYGTGAGAQALFPDVN